MYSQLYVIKFTQLILTGNLWLGKNSDLLQGKSNIIYGENISKSTSIEKVLEFVGNYLCTKLM